VAADNLARLAATDASASVRLALAAALPMLPVEARWKVASSLASHAEDYWYLARRPDGRDQVVKLIASASQDEFARRLLNLLHFSLRNESKLGMPADWQEARKRLAAGDDEELQRKTDELSALFGDDDVLNKYRAVLANSQAPHSNRRQALQLLKRVGDRKAAPLYLQLLDDHELRGEAIELLANAADAAAADKLLEKFAALDEQERVAALNVLTSRADFALALLQAVEGGALDKKHLTSMQIRQMSNLRHQDVSQLLEKVWGKIGESSSDHAATIERLKKAYTTAPLWAFDHRRGRQVFERTCANCHPLDGSSTPLGPSLAGSWRNGIDYFLENIVDPNAVVGESFRTTLVVNDSGVVVSGLLDSETDTAVVIRTAEKKIAVPKAEIEERRLSAQSLMPTGLLDNLSDVERIEL
jgi:putative heme-binding domain-containing protein